MPDSPEEDRPLLNKNSREIGDLAVWTVTTAKPGNGVELLRDDRDDTYWQSDGPAPHLVNIQFQKKVRLTEIGINVDYKMDESYTPSKLCIRAGTSFSDLRDILLVNLEEPQGWQRVPFKPPNDGSDYLKVFMVQVAVLGNHQNGRDTHVRQIKIYGPQQDQTKLLGHDIGFSTTEFGMYSLVR